MGWWLVLLEVVLGLILFLCILFGYLLILVGEVVFELVEKMECLVLELLWWICGMDY